MKTLILAAGSGRNLYPFTETRPKPMISIGGRTILENSINFLKKAGVSDILMVVGHKKDKIINHFNRGDDFGVNIHYHEQTELNGIGNAVLLGKDKFAPGEYFMLVYGDIITSANMFMQLFQTFNSFKSPVASICLPHSSDMFGNVFLDSKVTITKLIEKPKSGNMGNYVLAGAYILPASFFDLLEKHNGSMEDALSSQIAKGDFKASIWEDEWIDIIYPWDILNANKILMDSWTRSEISKSVKIGGNVIINGPVKIEDGVVIKGGAILEGPCFIGKGSYIGNNTLIREYTAIGENCSIGYGVELKNCIMFGNSKVGRLSFVGDSILGEDVDVGAGAVMINRDADISNIKVTIRGEEKDSHMNKLGAFVGDHVKIGASNSISPGTIIRSGTNIPNNASFPNTDR